MSLRAKSTSLAKRCEEYANQKWYRGEWISKSEAKKCESAFPDRFEATSIGRRKVKLWQVEYTSNSVLRGLFRF